MEQQTYHFQINPDHNRKAWDTLQPLTRSFYDRANAVHYAIRLSRIFKAEIRMTTGNHSRASGAYFHYKWEQ